MEHNREYAKNVSKQVKEYFKKELNLKTVSVTMTDGVKYPYISAFIKFGNNEEFNIQLREKCLKNIYGDDFKANNDTWIAGNVSNNRIAMKPHEWDNLLLQLLNKV